LIAPKAAADDVSAHWEEGMSIRIRPAQRSDALHVAAFVDIAGHGIEMQEWRSRVDKGHSVFAAARRTVLEDTAQPYHYSRAHMLEADGEVAAGLIGGIVEATTSGSTDTPAYVRPLVELETSVPGSWLLLVIATYPEYRGRGFGALLMEHARQCAIRDGAAEMSLVTEDTNRGALGLYQRHGFREVETRPWLAYDGLSGPTKWIRLVRDL
jgi:ribosomal protein S18 acetylase RimI-like enzyme